MAPEPVTSERIYAAIKANLMQGAYPPGAVLVERRIAADLGVSISPVRASAYRLVGERMLELQTGGGFCAPLLSEAGLRSLYFWHGQLVRNAINANTQHPIGDGFDGTEVQDIALNARALFDRIGERSGNIELAVALRSAGERLHAMRLREPAVLTRTDQELAAVRRLTETGSGQDLIRAVWAYHRRRLRRIPQLIAIAHLPIAILATRS